MWCFLTILPTKCLQLSQTMKYAHDLFHWFIRWNTSYPPFKTWSIYEMFGQKEIFKALALLYTYFYKYFHVTNKTQSYCSEVATCTRGVFKLCQTYIIDRFSSTMQGFPLGVLCWGAIDQDHQKLHENCKNKNSFWGNSVMDNGYLERS